MGVLLALMLLCILAGNQTTTLSVREAMTEHLNVSESIAKYSGIIPEIRERSRLDKNFDILAGNRLSQTMELPEVPEKISNPIPEAATIMEKPSDPIPEPATIMEEPSVPVLKPMTVVEETFVPVQEPVVTPEESEPIVIPEEPEPIPDNEPAVSEIPAASTDDVEEPDQTFFCNGFLCDSSGMIIGCQDVLVTDGVLCLPFNEKCTGVMAGALDSLGAEVYEIYIPANIVSIEDGAFDGLFELFFIEVHPANPVYGSDEGYLYKK